MVRINLEKIEKLTDEHLLAEYLEIKVLFRSIPRFKGDIPLNYSVGKGHQLFFKDKLFFVFKRFNKICEELKIRGFNLNRENINDVINIYSKLPNNFKNDYVPTINDIKINSNRLKERILHPLRKKTFFHYYKNKIIL